jgi:hypothetical protein
MFAHFSQAAPRAQARSAPALFLLAGILMCGCGGNGTGSPTSPSDASNTGTGAPLGRLVYTNYCGDTSIGGTDSQTRWYDYFTRGEDGAVDISPNGTYRYPLADCNGSRSLGTSENTLRPDRRLTLLSEESANGATLRRYAMSGPGMAASETSYITMPDGDTCELPHYIVMFELYSAAEAAQWAEGLKATRSQPYFMQRGLYETSCGTWEALDGGQFRP